MVQHDTPVPGGYAFVGYFFEEVRIPSIRDDDRGRDDPDHDDNDRDDRGAGRVIHIRIDIYRKN
jgi:hypothetical protein